jgi:co-chaperonin GroES (HSP10)
MKSFVTLIFSLCIGVACSASAVELDSGSFKLDIPDKWQLVKNDNNTYIYKNEMNDKIRITHTDAFDSLDRSVEVLKNVMQDSATQPGLKIKDPLKKYNQGPQSVWFIGSSTQTESKFLNQYGLVGSDQVIFIAHTGLTDNTEDKNELINSLSKIVWQN